jgi:hypothetical protein
METAAVDVVKASFSNPLKAVGVLRPIYLTAGLYFLEVPKVFEEETQVLLRDAWT